jgi:hypothetical protein
MPASTPDLFDDDAQTNTAGTVDARNEDAHWSRFFHLEHYCCPGLDYEDYAAAYCVGYVGYAQYGGAFEDAEKSLCANWLRLKGDSRLSLLEALPAIRAAWDRMHHVQAQTPEWDELYAVAGAAAQQRREPATTSARPL